MWFKNILRRNISTPQARGAHGRTGSRKSAPETFQIDEGLLRRLERLSIEAQRSLVGNPNSGEHPSRQRLPTSIFSEHRPYSHGDDYRTVDWNAYARHEQIVVKLGEAEQDINVHIVVDCSASMNLGTPTKLVASQQLTAAIGYVALSHSDRVRITPFGAGAMAGFGPTQGKGRAVEMLQFIRGMRSGRETQLARVLQNYARQHERGGLLVICSDLLATPADGLAEGLRAFTPPRWQVLVLHVLDRREIAPEPGETVELEDAETGERVPMAMDADTIAAYKRNVAAWQDQLAATCAQRGATYAQVLTDWPFEKAIVPYLRLRRIVK